MSSFFSKSSRAKGAVSSTPSSPPSLYSYTAPRIGSVSVPPSTTSSLAPPSSSASRLAAPSVFSTPPCSPPASPQHLKSALVPFRSATSPHPASTASALTSPELSPPPEKYSQLHGVEILAQTFMGKKGAGAKKKGKAKAKAKAKTAPVATSSTAAPTHTTTGKHPVDWAESTTSVPYNAVSYASNKHKNKKHEVDYAKDYDDDVSDAEAYWEDHWEDERRGRSSRPRLLWRSNLDDSVLDVLDQHCHEVRGTKVPRLKGDSSTEGRKWSRELEKCGL